MSAINRPLAAAALLVVLVNLVVLAGVAWNRGGAPESVLALSERELSLSPNYSAFENSENSGMTLRLVWSVEPAHAEVRVLPMLSTWPYGAWQPARWLDSAKLAALGFDVSRPLSQAGATEHYEHMLARDVLLVLELDGAACAAALARARVQAAQADSAAAQHPDSAPATQQARMAHEMLQQQELKGTRLFVVDAGLEARALRARYPDRSRYAIVRGSVSAGVEDRDHEPRLYGRVTAVRCDSIYVPLRWRAALPARFEPYGAPRAEFQVALAFGQRLEPWIVKAGAPPGS